MGYTSLKTLYNDVLNCTKCELCKTRTNSVFGEGSLKADLMFIGEAPGKNEDEQGRPFVGEAGKLLDRLIAGIGMKREDAYIANVLKCRPPYNRDPNEYERAACMDYLRAQIAFVKPKVIVCLGRIAAGLVLKRNVAMTREHGTLFEVKNFFIIPTYHPAALLRNAALIPLAEEDFQFISRLLYEHTQNDSL